MVPSQPPVETPHEEDRWHPRRVGDAATNVGATLLPFLELSRGYRSAMNTVKSLWASVQGDPVFMRCVNGWLTIFWIVMIPVSYSLGWLNSVVYVSALSLWALVSGHWAAWQAARVEVKQDAEAKKRGGETPVVAGGRDTGRSRSPGVNETSSFRKPFGNGL
jgi:hypothetical protein